jgi:hypothetical protein
MQYEHLAVEKGNCIARNVTGNSADIRSGKLPGLYQVLSD